MNHRKPNRKLRLFRRFLLPVASTVPAIYFFSFLLAILLSFPVNSQISTSATNNGEQNHQKSILIVYQKSSKINNAIISQLENSVQLSHYKIHHAILNFDNLDTAPLNDQQLVIAIGSKTTKVLLDNNLQAPLLSVLMPKHLANSFQQIYKQKKNWSSLIIDHPIERQFHLITAVMGKYKKTGVLLGPYTEELEKPLKRAATKTRQRVITEHIKDPDLISTSIKSLNTQADVLLTLPDPVIYNKNTIRGILLSSYRKKLPIIGFSKAYVKAGAIAAVYSQPDQISKQLVSIVKRYLSSNSFQKKIYYPDDFSIALNRKLAKSLDINMRTEAEIIQRIKKAEKTR